MRDSRAPDYILLSDIHLGADLVQHVRPWSRDSWLTEQAEIDHRLESMIEHHVERAERTIRFVIAGDFVDFIGMSLPPPDERTLPSGLTAEERDHGLGSASDHSAHKVRAVAARHERVFRALARALDVGHELVIVQGNHDAEWHWPAARRAFLEGLSAHVANARREALRKRVQFHPWFYYVPGLLYVEHGHEFDPMCSYGDPLLPLCPRDPRRIRATPSEVLLRYVARPTRGLSTHGHEQAGFGTYLRMARTFGPVGAVRLFVRFARASLRLLRDSTGRPGMKLERRSARRLRALGRHYHVGTDLLRTLKSFHTRPIARSAQGLVRCLYWDRIALALFVALAWALALLSAPYQDALRWSLLATVCAVLVGLVSSRGRDIDPSPRMRRGAWEIARRLGVPYVVMGHTHEPRFERLSSGGCYVNLGHWGQDELPEDRDQRVIPVSSYLRLVHDGEEGYRATLCAWGPLHGSRVLLAAPEGEALRPAGEVMVYPVPAQ
jgi:UDP-2,3-diacylglucosamine pyrophosphatase LpxH